MALSIKTAEADGLARTLARLTGETMTEAVTAALRERLEREQARGLSKDDLAERIAALVERFSGDYDGRPVSRAEWNWASGDED